MYYIINVRIELNNIPKMFLALSQYNLWKRKQTSTYNVNRHLSNWYIGQWFLYLLKFTLTGSNEVVIKINNFFVLIQEDIKMAVNEGYLIILGSTLEFYQQISYIRNNNKMHKIFFKLLCILSKFNCWPVKYIWKINTTKYLHT